nr:CHASE3 domain-containing protein [uncultured Flavobacterium sp.]
MDHSNEVRMMNDDVLIDILNIETGTRGYVITGNELFLEPYIKSANKIHQNLDRLKKLSQNNPSQLIRIKVLKEFIDKRLIFSSATIKNQKDDIWNNTEKKFAIEEGKYLTDTIRTIINNINSEELRLLKYQKIENEKTNQTSNISFALLLFLIIIIFILVVFILKNHKKRNLEVKEFIAEQKILSKYSLSLIEASLDPLVTINTEGKITDMNEATVTITGIQRDKLIGSDFFDYFTEPQKAREVYQKVFAKGSVADSPLTLRHKEGKLTDVLFNGSVYKDDFGNVLGVVIVARDIAEQKWALDLQKANKELAFQNNEKQKRADELSIANEELAFQNDEKEKRANELSIANKELAYQNDEKENRAAELIIANEELAYQNIEKGNRAAELILANEEMAFQNDEKEKRKIENEELEALSNSLKIASEYSLSLIEASRDPLFTISPKGKITDTNEASARVTGVTKKQLIGSDFFDYFTDSVKAREGYKEVFSEGFVVDYPLTIMDEKFTEVLFNGSVYKDEQGNVLGAVMVARDITEQKRIEREFIEAKIFAELATTIAEEEKNKAQNATIIAEEAVKSKQQFLSNMSHEIRTPMNAIIGFTKVVLKTDLTVKQKEYLNAIKISGDALIVLINDILDLAKVDAGKMQFEQIPFKLRSSIAAMLHLFESKIQEKNLKLIREFDPAIPEVLVGDPVRLHQIILNLISNAVKFTSKGKITVIVKLIEEDDVKVILEFAIFDTGIGISESKIETVFENFQQATSGTSRLYGGTGLGLAIVKQLVEPQGGSIKVESIVKEGSTFSFRLPFLKTKAEAQTELEILELDNDIKNLKVLVVEDMALNQLLMKTVLDDFGFERDIAENGKIAIEKLENNTYDIILMDLQMPEMNGFDATEYIRNTMKLTIPIIALTADVTTVDLEKCKAVGMNDYLAKPIDERLLYSKIVSLIKKNSVMNEDNIENTVPEIPKIKYINLLYLNQRTKSNPVLMMEMISIYLQQTPPLISSMKLSYINKDWKSLHSAVHKMIPSFSIMGISTDFENMAKKVQEFANTQQEEEDINEMVIQLEKVLNQSCSELEEELNRIKNIKS